MKMLNTPKPNWLKRSIGQGTCFTLVRETITKNILHTVCEEARCPNRGECYSAGTATFLILGDRCTRSCKFCAISHGIPHSPDFDESQRIAEAVHTLGLSYVVVTSVTRDDLSDGGAGIFAETIRAIHRISPDTVVEVLVPDFNGSEMALDKVCAAAPAVIGHNVETVSRLYPTVRSLADYHRSLGLIRLIAERYPSIQVKSGIMLGLGETTEEIRAVISELYQCGCDSLTIGQYLQPDFSCIPVVRYVPPEEFDAFAEEAREMGFRHVASGPFVRSSYHAAESYEIGNSLSTKETV